MAFSGDTIELMRSKTKKIKYQSICYVLLFLVPSIVVISSTPAPWFITFVILSLLPYLILGLIGFFSTRKESRCLFTIYGILASILLVLNVAFIILSIISLILLAVYDDHECHSRYKDDCRDMSGVVLFFNILTIIISALLAILLFFSAKHGIQCRKLMNQSPISQGYVSYA